MSEHLRFICIAAVINMTGLCRTSIYTLPNFPKPVKISGKNATAQGGARWVEGEVISWMQSLIQQRDGVL